MTLSGITACGCQVPTGTYHTSITLPATVTVTQDGSDPCLWTGTGGTLTRTIYQSAGCTGNVVGTATEDIGWSLIKTDGKWTLDARADILLDEKYDVFYDEQNEDDCSANVTFTNDFASGNCNDVTGTNVVVGCHSGTVTM